MTIISALGLPRIIQEKIINYSAHLQHKPQKYLQAAIFSFPRHIKLTSYQHYQEIKQYKYIKQTHTVHYERSPQIYSLLYSVTAQYKKNKKLSKMAIIKVIPVKIAVQKKKKHWVPSKTGVHIYSHMKLQHDYKYEVNLGLGHFISLHQKKNKKLNLRHFNFCWGF